MASNSHQHSDSCYRITLKCGKVHHTHYSPGCYKDGNLDCKTQEHSHTASCETRTKICGQ